MFYELDKKKLAFDIYQWRHDNKLTRAKACKLLGIHDAALVRVEIRHIEPKATLFFRLCKAMKKQPDNYFI